MMSANPRYQTIALAGFGLEGASAYQFLRQKYPKAQIRIYDQNPNPKNLPRDKGVDFSLGLGVDFSEIEEDLIVRSPGIALTKFKPGQNITSATNLFFAECPGRIIGVTGSKGKGTTASLIAAMLKSAGKQVELVGNIGEPALDALPKINKDTLVVYELSSFQLWDLTQTPDVSVVLHIEPDHLNVHTDFAEYVAAKAQIVAAPNHRKTQYLIYNHANQWAAQIANQAPKSFIKQAYPSLEGAHYDDKSIYYNEQKICSISDWKLLGKHNLDNACAAIDAAWLFSQDYLAFGRALVEFQGLDHRLQLVERVNGVDFIDDSIATTAGSVLAALQAVSGPKVLILGGINKGTDFASLRQPIEKSDVKAVLAIGESSGQIEQALSGLAGARVLNLGRDCSMQAVVKQAYDLIKPAGSVLLSPACSSFDMFKSYQDRGQQFAKAAKRLK